jgi:tetratricopeptide (TPR) repeat protein
MVGWIELQRGRYTSARTHLWEALDLARGEGGREARGLCQLELGRLAIRDGAYAEARDLLLESIHGLGITYRDRAARAQAASSYAAQALGESGAAREHLAEALQWARARGSYLALVEALPAAAMLLLDGGEVERAVEIYELALTLPYVANSQWSEDVVGKPIAGAAGALPPEAVAAAKERGRARDVWATCRELAEEFGR